jgi:hypothetical protein
MIFHILLSPVFTNPSVFCFYWRHCIPVTLQVSSLCRVINTLMLKRLRKCSILANFFVLFWAAFINLAAEPSCKTVVSKQRQKTCTGVWNRSTNASLCPAGQGTVFSPCAQHFALTYTSGLVLYGLQNQHGRAFPLYIQCNRGGNPSDITFICVFFLFVYWLGVSIRKANFFLLRRQPGNALDKWYLPKGGTACIRCI